MNQRIAIILSLTTGVLLEKGGFGDVHALAEHVAGHPIWTHEFAEQALWRQLAEAVFVQHPMLRDAEHYECGDAPLGEYLAGYVARATAQFGATLDIAAGSAQRSESPLESLHRIAPGATAVVALEPGK